MKTKTHRATLADNRIEYDTYVARRTQALHGSGAYKDRNDAELKAKIEARTLYGEQIPDYSASVSWSNSSKQRELNYSDYDKMIQDAKRR